VSGIGPAKADRYGEALLAVVATGCFPAGTSDESGSDLTVDLDDVDHVTAPTGRVPDLDADFGAG
jgi:hypothetical protein